MFPPNTAVVAARPKTDATGHRPARRWLRSLAVATAIASLGAAGGTLTAVPAHAASSTYTVHAGDTMARIARAHGIALAALIAANPQVKSPDNLSVGQVLHLPTGSTPTPKPAPTPSIYAPGTTVSYRTSQQVMVATRTSIYHGTWARYQWEGTTKGWVKVSAQTSSVFGENGTVVASRRLQGDHRSPLGTFPIEYTFGFHNPGSTMNYHTINSCSWFVEDPTQADYNRWRETCHGYPDLGEHMSDYRIPYVQGAVIGFNYDKPVHKGYGSGAGIFLHFGRAYTLGCIGITSLSELTNTITWMQAAQHPMIVIKQA